MSIVFAHLLNDCSGSPRILQSVIASVAKAGDDSKLLIGSDGSGCLDDTTLPTFKYWYKRGSSRWITLLTYTSSQVLLFLRLLMMSRHIRRDAAIYVNTLLPFGAALFGKLTGRPVIYHLHEVSISPPALQKLLTTMARLTASQLIYVSDFHQKQLPIAGVPATTIYNSLEPAFYQQASEFAYQPRQQGKFNVLMLSSLRQFKGIEEFITLAHGALADATLHFHLVANDEPEELERFFANQTLPANLTVYPRTKEPIGFYRQASLVLNLTRPDLCSETFGLTLLEAMAFGIPVIAPPVGGPAELVTNGAEGYWVDCRNSTDLLEKVQMLADNPALCMKHSQAARKRASQFAPAAFSEQITALLGSRGWLT